MDKFCFILVIINLGIVFWHGEARSLDVVNKAKRQISIDEPVRWRVRKQVEVDDTEESDETDDAINDFFNIVHEEPGAPTRPRPGNCSLSEWSEWGECVRTPLCENEVEKPLRSYKKPQGRFDAGAATMRWIMRVKEETDAETEKCQDSGTCPELDRRDSEGPVTCTEGMATIYPCRNVDQLAFLNLHDMGYKDRIENDYAYAASDVWGWTDPQDGQEYVLVGISGGTSFVRITPDPSKPQVLGFLPTRSGPKLWRDIKVVNDHAYIVSEAQGHGMQVFDLARLRDMQADSDRNLTADAVYSEFGNAHNIIGNPDTGFVYACGAGEMNFFNGEQLSYPLHCNGGLHIIDVSEPKTPRFVSCFYEDGYTHDAQCVIYKGPDQNFYGKEICFGYNTDTLTIIDVTDKKRMTMISRTSYERVGYTHQGWLTEDHTTIFMNDEQDETMGRTIDHKYTRTLIWDVRSLANPKYVREHISGVQSIDHNLYTKGDFVYESNYEAGLRILHFNPEGYHMMEVAYFDVFPSNNTANYRGTWSNYPYFDSGVVAVTSKEFGLFLVMPHYDVMKELGETHSVYGEQLRTREIIYADNGKMCPRRLESRVCEPTPCA